MSSSKKVVGILLDESGSMSMRKDETIQALNDYFDTLRKEKARVTLATFNSSTGVKFHSRSLSAKKVANLDGDTYSPNGLTPLHDAVGAMVGEIDTITNKGDKVLIVIVTDGAENSSQENSLSQIQSLIKGKERGGWTFTYIGATAAAWNGAQQMGVHAGAVKNIGGSGAAMLNASAQLSQATSRYFSGGTSSRNFYTPGTGDSHPPDASTSDASTSDSGIDK